MAITDFEILENNINIKKLLKDLKSMNINKDFHSSLKETCTSKFSFFYKLIFPKINHQKIINQTSLKI